MKGRAGVAVLIFSSGLASCQMDCPLDVPSAVDVTVVDDMTGEPVNDPVVWVQRGARVDTLFVYQNRASGPEAANAGFYAVHVEAEGYAAWVREDVMVTEDDCGRARTVVMTARLQAE